MGAPRPSFTLGIEEEFQIVDPRTRALKAHIQELFAAGESRLKDEIKREFHTGTDRQRDVFERTKSLPAVVDYILEETRHGLD